MSEEVEVFQRDYPKKSHLVAERIDERTIMTECGVKFETSSGGPITTFTYDPDESKYEQTYTPPVPEARCGRCSWDEVGDSE